MPFDLTHELTLDPEIWSKREKRIRKRVNFQNGKKITAGNSRVKLPRETYQKKDLGKKIKGKKKEK